MNVNHNSIRNASENLKGVALHTPLQKNLALSEKYQCEVYLKREDLQIVRSYKIRGAFNKISSLSNHDLAKGVICASAGNHAQGFAYSCNLLNIQGTVFMPNTTPKQKVEKVKMFGKNNVKVVLHGDTFDDSYKAAMLVCESENLTFIHPFNDFKVIEGQGTVAKEILDEVKDIDYAFFPVGGGGLMAGCSIYFKEVSPKTKLIAVEPEGAPALKVSMDKGFPVELQDIDKFVDGAAVQRVGDKTFEIIQKNAEDVILVPEGKVCTTILSLYNEEAIVVEPAGALTVACLDFYAEEIKGKRIVLVVSGSNNDIDRMQEIKERSMIYEGLKHFFIIRFPQRPGALKQFVSEIMGPEDDITRFEFVKKNARESGPALVAIELKKREDYFGLIDRMKEYKINFTEINEDPTLFQYFV